MFDILAAIQSADPPSLVLWGLFAFAAGMYPLGFMLGSSCSNCCGCGLCETGSLPDTVTVTFNNFHEKTVGSSRVYFQPLNQFSSCFGGGAEGIVTAPVGDPETDKGPITGVLLTNPGSGYAKLGREAPTLTVSGGSGTGLTVTPTVTATNDACGIPTWSVTSVKFSGGTGYANGEALTVTAQAGDTTKAAAVLTVQTDPRSQPTLSASVSGGTGATLTPTLAANGTTPQTWGVASVSVSGTTSDYTDGAAVTFSYGANVTEQTKATAVIKTVRTTPTITASASGGSGASLTATLSQSPTTPSDTALWHVDAVNVANGGTGYTNGDPVTFAVTDGTQVTAASGTIATNVVRENPNLTPYVWGVDGTTNGSGAVLSATMVSNEDDPETWGVFSINVIEGGSGYEAGEYFWYSEFGTGFDSIPPYYLVETDGWLITSVDENGAITGVGLDGYGGIGKFYKATGNGVIQSVTITNGGDYYKPTSEISRVVVTNPGQYYYYTGVPTGVTITNGGQYYREDASLPPYVATVTGNIAQGSPSSGTGAVITAIIDSNTSSPNFGRAVGLSIDDGGDGYLAAVLGDKGCCDWQVNGMPIVLKRDGCDFVHQICAGWKPNASYSSFNNGVMRARVSYRGPSLPPTVYLEDGVIGTTSSEATADYTCRFGGVAEALVSDCSAMSFTARGVGDITATVSAGGDYDENFKGKHGSANVPYETCTACCQGAEEIPEEIEVDVEDNFDLRVFQVTGGPLLPSFFTTSRSGAYVLPLVGSPPESQPGTKTWAYTVFGDADAQQWAGQPASFGVSVTVRQGRCSGHGADPDCDHCIKKCEAVVECGYNAYETTDMRFCPSADPLLTIEQKNAAICQSMCDDVPLCAPQSGREFSFYYPWLSDSAGRAPLPPYKNPPTALCDENTLPPDPVKVGDAYLNGPPLPHLNVFKVTIR